MGTWGASGGARGVRGERGGVRGERVEVLGWARGVLGAALARCGVPAEGGELTQFVQVAGAWLPDTAGGPVVDRPPMRELLVR